MAEHNPLPTRAKRDNTSPLSAQKHKNANATDERMEAPPGIEPGYDYIWGSDQDELVQNHTERDTK